MRKLLLFLGLALVGCGVNPGTNPGPVEISGRVTQAGKPVSDVTLNLQPTGPGSAQATLPVKNGDVKGSVNPGRYTYYITEGPKPAAFQAIPAKYREGDMDRQIEVSQGTPLTITLD